MIDIIHLLPDNIANQIAAGEVVQRPANVLKELVENAIDAGATKIKIIIEDSGKALLQVIDNGCGMSQTDARMAFERHATSKIKSIDDLFSIKTMGFRGEALASIAAVSQVILKTQKLGADVGTFIEIENSKIVKQEAIAKTIGTNIAMKNLFFNIPARRHFLKSNASELKAILEEFLKIALSFIHIQFELFIENEEKYHLIPGNLLQRISQIFGDNYQKKIIPISDHNDTININGFIGKPEASKKQRGEQYLFINQRFVKNYLLEHAIKTAYNKLLPEGHFPFYTIFIELDPKTIDINVHPTKQEIKFSEEKWVYNVVQAVVKHQLAQFNVLPPIDFDLDPHIQQLEAIQNPQHLNYEKLSNQNLYQTFKQQNQAHLIEPLQTQRKQDWDDFYGSLHNTSLNKQGNTVMELNPNLQFDIEEKSILNTNAPAFQINNCFIIAPLNIGYIIVHQQYAHERIVFERMSKKLLKRKIYSQKLLFPSSIQVSPTDQPIFMELIPELSQLGFQIEAQDASNYHILATPTDFPEGTEQDILENLIEQYKHFNTNIHYTLKEKLIRCLSKSQAIKIGTVLSQPEMMALIEELLVIPNKHISPAGYPTYFIYGDQSIEQLFEKKI